MNQALRFFALEPPPTAPGSPKRHSRSPLPALRLGGSPPAFLPPPGDNLVALIPAGRLDGVGTKETGLSSSS
ncbi:MAG: hypothetical protein ACYDC1_04950 [Limisphaerales bacterium]